MTKARPIPPAVLSAGRFYCDFVFSDLPRLPTLGTEVFAEGFSIHAGGGAFITAAHLGAIGANASLATMLPSPPFLHLVRDQLEAAGLDYGLSGALPASEGPQLTVAMAQSNERAFLSRRAGPAIPILDAAVIAQRRFRHLHIGEIASAIASPDIIALARGAGMTISLDCGWDDSLTADAIAPLVGAVDVFLPNAAEKRRLVELGVTAPLAPLEVVKQGADGSMAMFGGETTHAPAKPVPAVDTTGAGDAFNAGFLFAWMSGASLSDCLAAGNARGALAIQHRGGATFASQPESSMSEPLGR